MNRAYLTKMVEPNGDTGMTVQLVNYDDRYYANDKDFINGLITEDGYGRGGGFHPGAGNEYPSNSDEVVFVALVIDVGKGFSDGRINGVIAGALVSSPFDVSYIRSYVDEGNGDFTLGVMGTPPDNLFSTLTWTGLYGTHSFNSADASITATSGEAGPYKLWQWIYPEPTASLNSSFEAGTQYTLDLT